MDDVESDYQCDVCDQVFQCQDDLQKHSQTHVKKENKSDIDEFKKTMINNMDLEEKHSDVDEFGNRDVGEFRKDSTYHEQNGNVDEFKTRDVSEFKKDMSNLVDLEEKYSDVNEFQNGDFEETNCNVDTVDHVDEEEDFPVHFEKEVIENINGVQQCNLCDEKFESYSDLEEHCKLHVKEEETVENKSSYGENSLEQVGESETNIETFSKKTYRCEICGRIFKWRGNLRAHSAIHTGIKPYKCDVCGKSFSRLDSLQRHVRFHTQEKPFKCPACGKLYADSSSLSKHKKKCYAQYKKDNKIDFLVPETKSLTGMKKTYDCHLCDKTFKWRSNLRTHNAIHTGVKPFECDLCDKAFSRPDALQRHIRCHTQEKPYKCDECGKLFGDNSSLSRHKKIHNGTTPSRKGTGERPYECGICNKAFSQFIGLHRHMRIHTGEKPFECGVCGKSFSLDHTLRKHIRIHSGERPYKCDFCNKSFRERGVLVTHVRTHTGEKPFKCDICYRAFGDRSSVGRHMKSCKTKT